MRVARAIGEQVSAVLRRCTEHGKRPRQCRFGTGAQVHLHRLGGQPDRIDADCWVTARKEYANPPGYEITHLTVINCPPADSAMITLLRLAVWENAEQVNSGYLTYADLIGECLVLQGCATYQDAEKLGTVPVVIL